MIESRRGGPAPNRRGYTLLEIAGALALIGLTLPPLLSLGAELRSRALVSHAVGEASALLARARWEAVSRGGAEVVFSHDPPRGVLFAPSGDTLGRTARLPPGLGLALSGGRRSARIRYGPLGLGRVSSLTLRFTHGSQDGRLIVSSLGRARRP